MGLLSTVRVHFTYLQSIRDIEEGFSMIINDFDLFERNKEKELEVRTLSSAYRGDFERALRQKTPLSFWGFFSNKDQNYLLEAYQINEAGNAPEILYKTPSEVLTDYVHNRIENAIHKANLSEQKRSESLKLVGERKNYSKTP